MISIVSNIFPISSSIYFLVVTTLIIWYLQFLWNQRHLYKCASKVNGPLSLPIVGGVFSFIKANDFEDILSIISKMSDKYSDFYHIWFAHKLKYIVTKPEYIDIILNSPHAIGKEEIYEMFECVVGQGLATTKASNWKKQRKIVTAFFNHQNLQQYLDATIKYSELMASNIKHDLINKNESEIENEIISTTLSTIFEILFGPRPAQVTKEFNSNMLERLMDFLWVRTYTLYYHSDFIYNISPEGRKINKIIKKFHNMLDSVIESKLDELKENNDINMTYSPTFLTHLIEKYGKLKEQAYKIKIREELFTVLIAGSDTTSTSACYALMILGMFPHIQKQVYEEIMSVTGDSRNIDPRDLNQLKYLDRVLKESLRLFPIAPILGRQILGDIHLKDDVVIPADSGVIINVLHLHRSAKYWPDPLKFDPDRFLPENIPQIHRGSYLAFSHGPRNCVGMTYGSMSLRAIVATMVKNFVITTDYKSIEDVELGIYMALRPKNGYKLHLELRE